MKYCFNAESVNLNLEFVEKFKKIYESGFPDENEREEFQVILSRVNSLGTEKDPNSMILIHTENTEVTGGLIIDWYNNSKSI